MKRILLSLAVLLAFLPCAGCITASVIDERMAEGFLPEQKPYKPEPPAPIIPPKVTKFDLDVVSQTANRFTLRMGAETLIAICDGEWVNYAVQGVTWVSGNCGPVEAEIGQHAAMTQTEGDLDSPAGRNVLRYACDLSKCPIPTVVVLGIETIDQRRTRESSELAEEYTRQQAKRVRADLLAAQAETDRLARIAASEAEGRRVRAKADAERAKADAERAKADADERERLAAPEKARKAAEYAAQQAAEQQRYAENDHLRRQREKNAWDAFSIGADWGWVKKYCKKHPEGAWRTQGYTETCINTALGWTPEDYCAAIRGRINDSACPNRYY